MVGLLYIIISSTSRLKKNISPIFLKCSFCTVKKLNIIHNNVWSHQRCSFFNSWELIIAIEMFLINIQRHLILLIFESIDLNVLIFKHKIFLSTPVKNCSKRRNNNEPNRNAKHKPIVRGGTKSTLYTLKWKMSKLKHSIFSCEISDVGLCAI